MDGRWDTVMLREIVGYICVVVAIAISVPVIGAVMAILEAALFQGGYQGDDNAE